MSSKSKLIINCGTSYVTAGYFSVNAGHLLLESFYAEELLYDYSNQADWFIALAAALKKMNVKGKAVVIAPSGIILPKTIQVPHVTGDKQREVIAFEAEKNIPYSLNEVAWDYQVISDDGIETEILLVSMKKTVANELCSTLASAGIVVETLQASSMLDYNTWKFCGLPEDSIMLNVGAKSTNLIIAKQDALFVRTLPIGGNTLTQAIADSLGKTFLQAESIKTVFFSNENNMNSTDPAVDIFKNNEKSVLKRISMEIKRSILSYKRKVKAPIAKIYLAGRSSLLPNLSATLCEDQGVDVEYINPLESLAISPKVDPNLLAYNSTVLTELVGEAARMLLADSVGVNLLPEEIIKDRAFAAKKPIFIISALILAGSMILPYLYLGKAVEETKASTRALKLATSQMQKNTNDVIANKAKVDILVAQIEDLEGLANSKSNWLKMFIELEKSAVEVKDVWFDSLVVTRTDSSKASKSTKKSKSSSKKAKAAAEDKATPEYKLTITGKILLWDNADLSAEHQNELTKKLTDTIAKNSSFFKEGKVKKSSMSGDRLLVFEIELIIDSEKPI